MAYPRFQLARTHKFVKHTSGANYSISITTFAELDSTNLRLVVPAQAGDTLLAEVGWLWGSEAVAGHGDAATIVGGAITNRFTSAVNGAGALHGASGALAPAWANIPYVVVAGDIDDNTVTVSPVVKCSSAVAKTIFRVNESVIFTLRNLGPADPN